MKETKVRTWTLSTGHDGVRVVLQEKSFWGHLLYRMIEASDLHWIKIRKQPLFCWINPWGWTWRVGTEEHNLGSWWWDFGNWWLNLGWKAERERVVWQIPVTVAQLKEHLPEDYEFFSFLLDDEETT